MGLRKRLVRQRAPMALPDRVNQRWSLDFVTDQLASGRRFCVLNIVDYLSRECVGQLVDTSIFGRRLARSLGETVQQRSLPAIVCDNGPELTSKAMFFWARERKVILAPKEQPKKCPTNRPWSRPVGHSHPGTRPAPLRSRPSHGR